MEVYLSFLKRFARINLSDRIASSFSQAKQISILDSSLLSIITFTIFEACDTIWGFGAILQFLAEAFSGESTGNLMEDLQFRKFRLLVGIEQSWSDPEFS